MKGAVLMTCFNRAETTLKCLSCLFRATEEYSLDVYLNDDGSTDGTGTYVRRAYPSVHIVQGSGHDYWCGGMRRAWQAAIDSGIDYDGYLWLNDDTFLYEDAVKTIFSTSLASDTILVGAVKAPDENRVTYAGRDASQRLIVPSGTWHEVHTFNGNFVWISQKAFSVLGNFPCWFTHSLGDFDYGYRAKEQRVKMYQMPYYVGVCDDKKTCIPWMDSDVPFFKRLRNLYSPIGGPEPSIFFRYNLSHFGLGRAMRVWIQQHIHLCVPRLWLKCVFLFRENRRQKFFCF